MRRGANDNWPEGQLLVVSHAVRGDRFWINLQTETQDQFGAALRAMYADLVQQPLSSRLTKLIRQIETRLETSRHAG